MPRSSALALLLCCLPLAVGCATARTQLADAAPAANASPDLRQARLEYVVGGTAPVHQASHSDETPAPRHQVTRIEYPHPSGDKEKALASLVVLREGPDTESAPSGRFGRMGAWASHMLPGLTEDNRVATAKGLTISKDELDQLLRDVLTASESELSRRSTARLAIEVNDLELGTHAASHPALETLTQRIAADGQVLPANHPHVATLIAEHDPASDDFYRALREKVE